MRPARWSTTALVCAAAWVIACAFGGPPVVASQTTDACGVLSVTADVPRGLAARQLELWSADQRVGSADVPAAGGTVTVSGFVGTGRHVTPQLRLGRQRQDLTADMPPWALELGWDPSRGPIPADAAPVVDVTVVSPCADLSMLTVSAAVVSGPSVWVAQPLGDRRAVSIPAPALPQGEHGLRVELGEGPGSVVASAVVPFVIGPPCVDLDGDGALACEGDCDDTDPKVFPGAKDIRGNRVDDDCDGVNGVDRDADGYEDAAVGGDDCDDRDAGIHPGATTGPDADGDGAHAWRKLDYDCDGVLDVAPGEWDCDDADPRRPQPELSTPNGVDDDCDGKVDEGTVAYDDDGDGQRELDGDCDDDDPRVYAGARELGDCRDNDCDGVVDEGVTRPSTDDRYEPNDERAHELPGAVKRGKFLGFGTGYKETRADLGLITRDRSDSETFSVWTHDGNLDDWHVTAAVAGIGDGRSYDVTIEGNGQVQSGTVHKRGDQVRMLGTSGTTDTGTYTITIRPRDGDLPYCPLDVVISSG